MNTSKVTFGHFEFFIFENIVPFLIWKESNLNCKDSINDSIEVCIIFLQTFIKRAQFVFIEIPCLNQ